MTENETYTLAELGPLLCPGGDDRKVYQTTRRIQNWVTARLLRPVGGAHSGRGIHRRYDSHELGKAAVLLELHRYQMPAKVLDLAADLFDDARDVGEGFEISPLRTPSPGQRRQKQRLKELFDSAWRGKVPVYLIMHVTPRDELDARLGSILELPNGARSVVVLDLTEILFTLP